VNHKTLPETGTIMRDLIQQILRMLVDHPDDVRIVEMAGESKLVYEVRCHSDDIGKVIGKDGKTVGAVRALLNVIAARGNKRVLLEVVE